MRKQKRVLAALVIASTLAFTPTMKAQSSGGGGGGGWSDGQIGSCGSDPLCGIDPMNLLNCNNAIDKFLGWLFGITCVPY